VDRAGLHQRFHRRDLLSHGCLDGQGSDFLRGPKLYHKANPFRNMNEDIFSLLKTSACPGQRVRVEGVVKVDPFKSQFKIQ
jgi:hypothetical protein